MMNPYLAKIFIYPIKSLDRIALEKATILESGAIKCDREWAIFDEKNRFVNGKRNAKVHLLRSSFDTDLQNLSLTITETNEKAVFHIERERTALESWLSNYFGFSVKFVQNSLTGFPDDTNALGPTIISTETIKEVASWFPGLSVEEMRFRLRANLEIDGVPPFWEDQLFADESNCVQFQIGEILFQGINPCQRCVVPTRDSMTGIAEPPNFQEIFIAKRKETLPPWTTRDRFNHFYKLSVNTRVPKSEAGKILSTGNSVKIIA